MTALELGGGVFAAVGSGFLSTYLTLRYRAKENAAVRAEAVKQAQQDADRQKPILEDGRIARLFDEAEELRRAYRKDIAELRDRLADAYNDTDALRLRLSQAEGREQVQERRISLLELELAEWRAGGRGIPGVWVAVPSSIWSAVRSGHVPALPDTPLPGEHWHEHYDEPTRQHVNHDGKSPQ